jgi:serine phosphatase RsbU (regulator of sigma subunit)
VPVTRCRFSSRAILRTPSGNPGTLLGVLDTVDIKPADYTLHDGDVLVFSHRRATDVPKHSLDEQRWTELVATAARAASSAEAIADNIRDALEALLPFQQRNDDIALLIMKVVQATARESEEGR